MLYSNIMRLFEMMIFLVFSILLINSILFAENTSLPSMSIIKNVNASSFLIKKNLPKFSYHPINIFDENLNTAWFEGDTVEGINQYIEFNFFIPINIESISIRNGYSKSEKLFNANNRVKTFDILLNNTFKSTIDLKDTMEVQKFEIKSNNVKSIRFVIRDIYKGSKYNDTGISEVSFNFHDNYKYSPVLSSEEVNNILLILNDSFFEENGGSDILKNKLHKLTPNQLEYLFNQKYRPLDGAGNDERTYFFFNNCTKNKRLIPYILKAVYYKNNSGLFSSESKVEDVYAALVKSIYKFDACALPLIYQSSQGYYSTYYHILDIGDTRIVPKYLDKMIELEYWGTFCCSQKPHEILVKHKDIYSKRTLRMYLENREMYKVIKKELSKAISKM